MPCLLQLLGLGMAGQARKVVERLETQFGVNTLVEGLPDMNKSGVDVLLAALAELFPENQEANMLRTGLEFFHFAPRSGESLEILFRRYDDQLDQARQIARIDSSWGVQVMDALINLTIVYEEVVRHSER